MIWAAVTSLKPGQAWFPRMDCHGADGAGEGVPANEPCRIDRVSLLLYTGPQPPDPSRSSCSETMPTEPRERGASGLKELWKAPWAPVSWWWSSTSSLLPKGCPSYGWKHAPQSDVAGTGMCPGDTGKEGRRNGTQPWVFVLARSTLTDNAGTGRSPRLWSPSNQSWA